MINWQPIREDMALAPGRDVIFSRTSRAPIPPGTTAEVVWNTPGEPTVWPGVVESDRISWRVQAEEADAIPTGTAFTIWVHYPTDTEDTDDYDWYVGCASRFP